MKAYQLIDLLEQGVTVGENTCDTVKAGDPQKEINKVAISMFATVDVIRRVTEWGADMLIVHEPTYYDHHDIISVNSVTLAKKELIEESGLVIYRYHDRIHSLPLDGIAEGVLKQIGLEGKLEKTQYFGSHIFTLESPMTALELARHLEKKLDIAHIRIAGTRDKKSARIATCFGTPSGRSELLADDSVEIVLTGETVEWECGEFARDADLLGKNKTLMVLGHIGSERDGMKLLAEKMKVKFKEFKTQYFECEEVYTYTDTER